MINCLLVPEWWEEISDAVYVVVGAVLGVISSLLISWGAKKYGIHRLKKMLNLEVDSIVTAVDNISEGRDKEIKSTDAIDFPSPLWSFIGQTSTLLDLSVKDYEKVVTIYVEIKKFREAERIPKNRDKPQRAAFIKTLLKNRF